MGRYADGLERTFGDRDALALFGVPTMGGYADDIGPAFTLAGCAILTVIVAAENGFAYAGATVSILILPRRALSPTCALGWTSEAADRVWLPGINGINSFWFGALAAAGIGVIEGERRQAFVASSFVLADSEDQARGISICLIEGFNFQSVDSASDFLEGEV